MRLKSLKHPFFKILRRPLKYFFLKQDSQCTFSVTFGRFRLTIVAVVKQLIITYSEYVSLALVIQ